MDSFTAFVHFGDADNLPMKTVSASAKVKALDWQEAGLQQTATGYGKRLTTRYMINLEGRWRRVYSVCYSNCATHYIGHIGKDDFAIVKLEVF